MKDEPALRLLMLPPGMREKMELGIRLEWHSPCTDTREPNRYEDHWTIDGGKIMRHDEVQYR